MAYNLRRPVAEVYDMPYLEYLGWLDYFDRRPIGWREDDRTHKLLQAQGVTAKGHEVFESLARLHNQTATTKLADGQISTNNLKASAFFQRMLSSKGGANLGDIFDNNEDNRS